MIPLKSTDERSIQIIASNHARVYRSPVAANSATGFGDPSSKRRTGAHTDCRRFFCARKSVLWRSCVGDREVCRVPFAPVRQPAHGCLPSFGDDGGSSYQQKELYPMIPTRNPSALLARAAAHRAMAMSALSANSSLSSRLKRYNHHMTVARSLQALEAEGMTHGQH